MAKSASSIFSVEQNQCGKSPAVFFVNGFLAGRASDVNNWRFSLNRIYPFNKRYHVVWESGLLREIGEAISSPSVFALFSANLAALDMTWITVQKTRTLWKQALDEAEFAGGRLAQALSERDEDAILLGHSLGARVVFHALSALANGGAPQRILEVHLLGGAVTKDSNAWASCADAVSGTIYNYYTCNDRVLRHLYRLGDDPIGISLIDVPGVRNVSVSKWVTGHTGHKKNFHHAVLRNREKSDGGARRPISGGDQVLEAAPDPEADGESPWTGLDLPKLLHQMAEKYDINTATADLVELQGTVKLSIGFLGEYSTGKSTLINAMLGQKVLPAMENPTTRNIVEVEGHKGLEKKSFFRVRDGVPELIDAVDFQDIATGDARGTARLHVPATGMLRDGFRFIDTPGLESINDMDVDVTLGYLPFIDGAVICVDVQHGCLKDSMLEFLRRADVAPFAEYFLFAITRADTKPGPGVDAVMNTVVEQLREHIFPDDAPANVADRVIAVSRLHALDGDPTSGLAQFESALARVVFDANASMERTRRRKEHLRIARAMVVFLHQKRDALNFDESTLRARQQAIQADIQRIRLEREVQENKLPRLRAGLRTRLDDICTRHQQELTNAGPGEIEDLAQGLVEEINGSLEAAATAYLDGMDLPAFSSIDRDFVDKIHSATVYRDIAVAIGTVMTGATVTILTGGAAAAGGGVLALAGAVRGILARRSLSEGVGRISSLVNPVEPLASYLARRYRREVIEQSLPVIADRVSADAYVALSAQVQSAIIKPLEEHLAEQRGILDACVAERRRLEDGLAAEIGVVDADVAALETSIGHCTDG